MQDWTFVSFGRCEPENVLLYVLNYMVWYSIFKLKSAIHYSISEIICHEERKRLRFIPYTYFLFSLVKRGKSSFEVNFSLGYFLACWLSQAYNSYKKGFLQVADWEVHLKPDSAAFLVKFVILMLCLFVCARPAVSRGSKAPPKVRQRDLDRQRESGKKRRNQPIQVS